MLIRKSSFARNT